MSFSSSSRVHSPFLRVGSRDSLYRFEQASSVLPGIWRAIWAHLEGNLSKRSRSNRSSSGVQADFFTFGCSECSQRWKKRWIRRLTSNRDQKNEPFCMLCLTSLVPGWLSSSNCRFRRGERRPAVRAHLKRTLNRRETEKKADKPSFSVQGRPVALPAMMSGERTTRELAPRVIISSVMHSRLSSHPQVTVTLLGGELCLRHSQYSFVLMSMNSSDDDSFGLSSLPLTRKQRVDDPPSAKSQALDSAPHVLAEVRHFLVIFKCVRSLLNPRIR